jgi:signal transduction histidine kinase
LLSNAIKFTLRGGITVKEKVKDNKVKITIEDTGVGIKNEDLPHIFDEFCCFTVHKNLNPNGTGLGLYLSRNLA